MKYLVTDLSDNPFYGEFDAADSFTSYLMSNMSEGEEFTLKELLDDEEAREYGYHTALDKLENKGIIKKIEDDDFIYVTVTEHDATDPRGFLGKKIKKHGRVKVYETEFKEMKNLDLILIKVGINTMFPFEWEYEGGDGDANNFTEWFKTGPYIERAFNISVADESEDDQDKFHSWLIEE